MKNDTSLASAEAGRVEMREKETDGYGRGGYCHLLLLRSPLEMDSLIFPHLRGTFVAADITTMCHSGSGLS